MTSARLSVLAALDNVDRLAFDAPVDRAGLVDYFERMLRAGGRRTASVPPREIVVLNDAVGVSMPCYAPQQDLFVVKSGIVKIAGDGGPTPTVVADVTAYSVKDAMLLGHFDGDLITRLKCFALSAVVLRQCAPPGPVDAVIVGTGIQAWEQFLAMEQACTVREYRVAGRSMERTGAFVRQMKAFTRADVRWDRLQSLPEMLSGVSLVATATRANTPLDDFAQIAPDAHINCMGGHTTLQREVPNGLMQEAFVVVEDRAQAIREAGPVHETAAEIEDLFGPVDAKSGLSIFSSVGNAYHDLMVVSFLMSQKRQEA